MQHPPECLFSPAQVRERDRLAIEEHGVPGYELMRRAAGGALALARARWPHARRPLVLCGVGNNAGDGYVFARLAADAGLSPLVVPLFDVERLRGDAQRAFEDLRPLIAGGRCTAAGDWREEWLSSCDLVVDAIFGTGLDRDVAGLPAEVIRAVNGAALPRLALDVPSGLNAETGQVLGTAFQADATVTFVGRKIGFYLGRGQDFTGEVLLDDLGVQALIGDAPGGVATLLDPAEPAARLPARRPTSHKTAHGHVLVVGGGEGMSGAARLAAEAALYAGAGLVSVATAPAHAAWLNVGRPELMCRGVDHAHDLAPLLERADVVVAGPGMGRDGWAQRMLQAVLDAGQPLILDADGLNLLAEGRVHLPRAGAAEAAGRASVILTPHPGEAGRLLGSQAGDVQGDRLGASRRLAERFGAVAVLKGAGTIVAAPGELPAVCGRGNPGMAAAGMGDVLSGVLGALLAQLGEPLAAARVGVMVHALAGDAAAGRLAAQRGLLATDLYPDIRRQVNLPPGDRAG